MTKHLTTKDRNALGSHLASTTTTNLTYCPQLFYDNCCKVSNMPATTVSWDTLGPFLVWQFLIPLVSVTDIERRSP